MLKSIHYFRKNISNLIAATACLASPLLLTTAYKHLVTEDTSCWSFGREMVSHC